MTTLTLCFTMINLTRNACKNAFTLEKYFFPKVVYQKKSLAIIPLLLGNGICDNVTKKILH
jgi:hypothetical protein